MKIDRLLSITLYLINRKKVTARELADRFDVSLRTIQRDMETLSMAGIPVYADRGKDGGYRIIDSYTFNRQFFSHKELSALASLMGKLNSIIGNSGLKTTEEKLLNLMVNTGDASKHTPLIMDLTPWGVDETIRNRFQTVYRCVEASRALHIRYASAGGDMTERTIRPLSMIIKGTSWYVYAFCELRKDVRLFKLTRIMSDQPESRYFNPEEHPPYADTPWQPADCRPMTLFVLKFASSARGRITDYYNPDNLQFMPDGSIIGLFPFPEDEWVYSWILSFGPLVEVLEPPHATARINELIGSMKQLYTT